MTVKFFTVEPGFIEPGSRRQKKRWPCWNLVDHTGRVVGQSTEREGIASMIEAKILTELLVQNSALSGAGLEAWIRYQFAEELGNDPDDETEE